VPYWGPVTITGLTSVLYSVPAVLWRKLPLRFPGQKRYHSFAPLRQRDLSDFLRRFTIETAAEAHIEEVKRRNPVLVTAGCVIDEIAEILNPPNYSQYRKSIQKITRKDGMRSDFAEYDTLLAMPSTWLENNLDIALSDRIKQMLARFLHIASPLYGDDTLPALYGPSPTTERLQENQPARAT
jgi:hypothetical protein